MSPTWNAESKEFIHELKQLVNEYSPRVYLDEGNTSLMIKDRASGKKLMEYWPEKNKMINTKNDHKEAGVPQELSNDYHAAIAKHGNPVQDPKIFTEHLRKIIKALYRI